MSASIAPQDYNFQCRLCGRKAVAQFSVPWRITKQEAAKKVGMKNTRWGTQCLICPTKE